MTQRILIADARGELAAACATLLGGSDWECTVLGGLDAAGAAFAAGEPGILVVADDLVGDGRSLSGLLGAHAVPFVLGCTDEPTAADFRAALRLGAVGVVSPHTSVDELTDVLTLAARRGHDARVQRDELQRHEYLVAELRQRCADQARRFQESQDTFFLDLSRLMTIITNIMDGIVFVDRAGNVTLLNPVAEDLLGTKSFVAIGKPMQAMGSRNELVTALAHDHGRLQGHGDKEVVQTVEVHHNEQDLVYIQCITSRVTDYRGRPAGALSVLKNVTAEFKTDQLKNQYLSIVAHELRTPLTGIKTFSTMMAKGALGALNETQKEVCDSIREQSLRLEHQIDKLINLGSLESADYGQDRETATVAEFAAGLLLPFEQSSRDRRIDLEFEVCDSDQLLYVDRADLRRACQALVENAIKFTPDGGRVEVSITAGGPDGTGELRFRVVDDGIGIDPRYHRRIFEKFFQVEDPLTRHHGGAGLGLFVAKGIVEAHGSCIEVSSQLGQGADFSFVLPASEPANERTARNDVLV
ncbi:MAG: PAS domain S-box protein [Planctomycetes bacterium]|nr:PAS domain S-box protein [Planctomycetota bacterium]